MRFNGWNCPGPDELSSALGFLLLRSPMFCLSTTSSRDTTLLFRLSLPRDVRVVRNLSLKVRSLLDFLGEFLSGSTGDGSILDSALN